MSSRARALTMQEAAVLLNVSKTYLIGLVAGKKLRFRKVGHHRRVLFHDLLAYREKSKKKGQKARRKLIEQAQELNLGY